MTNDLEKQFFDTFGIEKLLSQRYHTSIYGSIENCIEKAKEWSKETGIRIKNLEIASDESIYFDKVYYPQITDRILLELIFILTTLLDTTIYEDVFITVAKNREELKKDIFQECMLYKQHIKHQVRTLFEEGVI